MAETSPVSVSLDGEIALVHLSRPPANSYDRGFIDGLDAAIDQVRFDEAIAAAVIVSDVPRFFSAGADVDMLRQSSSAHRAMVVLHAHEVFQKIERTPKVFVAALSGHTLGGGLELALACDFRIAAEGDYQIGLTEAKLGILPANGGTWRLQRLAGASRALEMMATGQTVSPREAAGIGIAERLVPAERLLEESLDFARKFTSGAREAVGAIKTAARLGGELPAEGAFALERASLEQLMATPDAAEGLAAFKEKRAARWRRG